MLANTFKRPRCAIPNTTSFTLREAAVCMMASKAGIVVSPPSREKRFSPMYFVPKNFSKITALLSLRRMCSFFLIS